MCGQREEVLRRQMSVGRVTPAVRQPGASWSCGMVTLLMPLCQQSCVLGSCAGSDESSKCLKRKFKQLKFSSSCAYLRRIADPSDRLFFVQIRLDFKLVGGFFIPQGIIRR